jgi:hypothetical protein
VSGQLPPEEVAQMVWDNGWGKPVAWENTNIETQDPYFQPLPLTTARWKNIQKAKTVDGLRVWKWAKILAHKKVKLTDFAYGTDTESTWHSGPVNQRCLIAAFHTRLIVMDMDDWANFLRTRTGQLLKDQTPISRRGSHCHYGIDAGLVPRDAWPTQGMINGTDHIKSNGFVPVPGCEHYSGEPYEPVLHADGNWHLIQATPWLIAAILADLADEKARRGWGSRGRRGRRSGGGNGGGDDDEFSSQVMSMTMRGLLRGDLDKEQCWAEWQQIAIPRDPADPFTREDFDRHYGDESRGALWKATARVREIRAAEEQAHRQYCQWLTEVTR